MLHENFPTYSMRCTIYIISGCIVSVIQTQAENAFLIKERRECCKWPMKCVDKDSRRFFFNNLEKRMMFGKIDELGVYANARFLIREVQI